MKSRYRRALHLLSRIVVSLVALVLGAATALPLLRSDAWWIRVLDFPRIQIAALIVLTLTGYAALRLRGRLRPWELALAAALAVGLLWQAWSIAPYTRLHPREMAQSQAAQNPNRLSMLVFNVLADNREVDALRDLIRAHDPDIILLSEPTAWWLDQLSGLEEDYPYTIIQPQENKYGKLLFSRLELLDPKVRFLIEPGIPSLRTGVRLQSGATLTLFGVHPRPPGIKVPESSSTIQGEDSEMRDAELLLVAKEVAKLGDVPVIVAGDFNDVAWSRTTHLFQRIGGLLDPRVGRGLFNSFDTRSRLLRFPLDHVFASQHFLLVELRRLPDIGSDHFPILVILDHDPAASAINDVPEPDPGDRQEAEEAIQDGKTPDQGR